jgi:hypothetical protein
MRSAWLAIGVLVISVASQTPSNKQELVPTAILLNSRYVYVEAWAGDFFNPHLLPEDRKAILDVQNALQDTNIWSRSNGATPKFIDGNRVYGAPASYHSLLVFLRGVPWLSVPHVTNAAEPAGTGTSNI